MEITTRDTEHFNVNFYVAIKKQRVCSIIYTGTLLSCVAFARKQLEYFKTKHLTRWHKDVHIIFDIAAKHETGERNTCWFMYEHAPEYNREQKKMTKQFSQRYNNARRKKGN